MIEKILKEINRLKGDLDGYSALEALDYIESYINVNSREPASEDLEEAANFYTNTHTEWFDSEGNPHVMPAFKAGAEWQKQQMMQNSIDGEVVYSIGDALEKQYKVQSERIKMDNFKFGDKVKLIIIKED